MIKSGNALVPRFCIVSGNGNCTVWDVDRRNGTCRAKRLEVSNQKSGAYMKHGLGNGCGGETEASCPERVLESYRPHGVGCGVRVGPIWMVSGKAVYPG